MKDVQYTIRSIPELLDKRLRARARISGKSLNAVVIEALEKAESLGPATHLFHDLDWFIGGKSLDQTAFDKSQRWLESLPSDMS